ncbi:protein serine/threonine kinase, putative [Entamoeba invadens IP1]|uniref:Protein serine/threonine kinase, putative n=1 Tax=Entamoeba invadens IP1 TaxID=370355 RepID=A0A0A1UB01_ENTIV|nr:protein serine/threonine kinase, putative [Entamoeba invadens IP1]ELP89354.1 protein serine/threonine kinase, putative [Entamoeba invadens IP1]|eukprot:XP_004256125.1 protein serine/threonine kinase, putative [Entamoeba invadens IP1]
MSHSNIRFISLNDGIAVNKTEIVFNDGDEVNVNEKLRELICVGNTTKHNMKIQILTNTSQNEKFEFTSNPQLIVLGKGEACEFEFFVTLFCTSKIQSFFLLVATAFDTQRIIYKEINFSLTAQLTTRLDPDELKEDKKLGEGSFGIVYKGTLRGNLVAIKKMKTSRNSMNLKMKWRCWINLDVSISSISMAPYLYQVRSVWSPNSLNLGVYKI